MAYDESNGLWESNGHKHDVIVNYYIVCCEAVQSTWLLV